MMTTSNETVTLGEILAEIKKITVNQQTILDLRKEVEDLKAHIKNPMIAAANAKMYKLLTDKAKRQRKKD